MRLYHTYRVQNLVKRLIKPPAWLRPPLVPLVYVVFVALPLSVWQSPGANPRATALLAGGLALMLLISATARSTSLGWARLYFALGAAFALFHDRFFANELAGIMLLFLPLAAALAGGRLSGARRLQAGLLALLFAGTLLATESRGGLLAFAAAGTVTLALERRWRLVAHGFLALAAVAPSLDRLIYDGKVQGLSVDSLLTGRPEIWRRSLHAVADFSWTGIGVGSFPEVVPALYGPAGAGRFEDAHSLPIQIALDLGAVGMLAMAAIVWLAFRRAWSAWRRAPQAGPRRAWAGGLFASLLAFAAFNLFDAVALGSAGGVAFFMLLGLIYALPPAPRRRRWRLPARGRRRLVVGVLFLLLGLTSIRGARQLNGAAVLGARAVVDDPALLPAAHAALVAAGRRNCRAGWLQGKVAGAWERPDLRDEAWAELLSCDDSFVPMIAGELPSHGRLAEEAVERQPDVATSYLWLARIRLRADERDGAERLYRRCLELDPGHGGAWLELGRLLAPGDPRAAFDAFVQSCRHGDPGANGCLAAGATAEQLGDVDAAIRYYGKSRLARARVQAEHLENDGDL